MSRIKIYQVYIYVYIDLFHKYQTRNLFGKYGNSEVEEKKKTALRQRRSSITTALTYSVMVPAIIRAYSRVVTTSLFTVRFFFFFFSSYFFPGASPVRCAFYLAAPLPFLTILMYNSTPALHRRRILKSTHRTSPHRAHRTVHTIGLSKYAP